MPVGVGFKIHLKIPHEIATYMSVGVEMKIPLKIPHEIAAYMPVGVGFKIPLKIPLEIAAYLSALGCKIPFKPHKSRHIYKLIS